MDLRTYRWLEARHVAWRGGAAALSVGALTVAGCQWLIPRLPAAAVDLMRVGFHLPDMTAVVLFNDYAGVYFFTFFAGLVGLLGVVAAPREEHRLELLLVKPIPAATLLSARTWPVLVMTTLVGLGVSLACAASAWSLGGASVSPSAALGAGLMMTAVVVLELAALGAWFVRATDTTHAVLVALLVALLPLAPTATFLYRPDVFIGREALASGLVTASLVWSADALVWFGPVALAAALVMAVGLVGVGGRLLARAGV